MNGKYLDTNKQKQKSHTKIENLNTIAPTALVTTPNVRNPIERIVLVTKRILNDVKVITLPLKISNLCIYKISPYGK